MKSKEEVLQRVYGYQTFRSRQGEIIDETVAGEDSLVVMPTGGGKSLCYQVPSFLRSGVAVIISPLIALMKDQVDALQQLGVSAAYLNSTLDPAEQRTVEKQLLDGSLQILYLAPERLNNSGFGNLISRARISLFAIDEAHCVSQWGHDFRPDYLQIAPVLKRFPDSPRMALTATADATTRDDIVKRLALRKPKRYVDSFDRPNIQYRIETRNTGAKRKLFNFINKEFQGESGIVYVGTRNQTEDYADFLRGKGISAVAYHAGMSRELRTKHQEQFAADDVDVVVATIAFGMGIDKPDIRYVVHVGLPKNIESYYQETGRGGRDGLPTVAWMLYSMQDVVRIQGFIDQSEAAEEHKQLMQAKLNRLLGLCETATCRRQALLAYFGERLEEPCGNCDTCLNPPELWNGTEAAKKALSAIYRTKQRFGSKYIIDLLRGSRQDRMEEFGHDQLPTFGVGKDLDEDAWRSVLRQLLTSGYIWSDISSFSSLTITEKGMEFLLSSDQTIHFRKDTRVSHREEKKRRKSADLEYSLDADEEELYERLREFRNQAAQKKGVPPYVIFNNKTLALIARSRPTSLEELRFINGIGHHKVGAYGQDILTVIREKKAANIEQDATVDLPEKSSFSSQPAGRKGAKWTREEEDSMIELYEQGRSIPDIAERLERSAGTISARLQKCAQQDRVELRE